MDFRDAYKIWASEDSKWTQWVRPVPFALHCCDSVINNGTAKEGSSVYDSIQECANHVISFDIPEIFYLDKLVENTAIIIDRCGYCAVNEGLALAEMGWRPIPLYNGTNEQSGSMALVDNHGIEHALLWGACVLKGMNISQSAPPAFLLDSNRRHRYKMDVTVFDNSWDLYNQDIPSPEYFSANGINKIIIVGEKIHKDLRVIFHEFQKKGISFFYTDGYNIPKEVTIKKPPRWVR